MAKELPYFKFFCSEWTDGDISLESFELQGLFINICSFYWSRECKLGYAILCKKFTANVEGINALIHLDIIKENDGVITINFLDEQLEERKKKSSVNSENGRKGGRPKKRNETEKKPNALISLSETKGNKKREEKRREDNIPTREEFILFGVDKKPMVDREAVGLKYDAWKQNNWKNGNDKPIKNWKLSLINTLAYIPESKTRNDIDFYGRIKGGAITE